MVFDVDNNSLYIRVRHGCSGPCRFLSIGDEEALLSCRKQHKNTDLFQAVGTYASPDMSSEPIYPLFFRIEADSLESVRESDLRVGYYMEEIAGIPLDFIEFIYSGSAVGGPGVTTGSAGDPSDRAADPAGPAGDGDGRDGHDRGAANPDGLGGIENRDSVHSRAGGAGNTHDDDANSGSRDGENQHSINGLTDGSPTKPRRNEVSGTIPQSIEMIVMIPAVVFGKYSGMSIPFINFELARKMIKAGIPNIDTDVYQRNNFIRMSNSLNSSTGRYVISLTFDEIMSLTPERLDILTESPRPEASMIVSRPVSQSVKWFHGLHHEAEKEGKRQQRLLQMVLSRGWEMPPCIGRLKRSKAGSTSIRFESGRILAWWFAWIRASPSQIHYELNRITRGFANQSEQHKFLSILSLSIENPRFAGCYHPLLRKHCPTEKCYMADLVRECEQPYLFPMKPDSKETNL